MSLVRMARAIAVANGRNYVNPEDIQAVAGPALAHRLAAPPRGRVRRGRAGVGRGRAPAARSRAACRRGDDRPGVVMTSARAVGDPRPGVDLARPAQARGCDPPTAVSAWWRWWRRWSSSPCSAGPRARGARGRAGRRPWSLSPVLAWVRARRAVLGVKVLAHVIPPMVPVGGSSTSRADRRQRGAPTDAADRPRAARRGVATRGTQSTPPRPRADDDRTDDAPTPTGHSGDGVDLLAPGTVTLCRLPALEPGRIDAG